jgi:transposase-like protein
VERRFDAIDLLVIYIDGMQFGEHHVIRAVGVDRAGHKHMLGIQQGARENAAAVEDLLEQLVARGVGPRAKRLFVIDGAQALRAAINKVFGSQHPLQRGRNYKIRDARQLQTGGERRQSAIAETGRLVGAGMLGDSQQFARMIRNNEQGQLTSSDFL